MSVASFRRACDSTRPGLIRSGSSRRWGFPRLGRPDGLARQRSWRSARNMTAAVLDWQIQLMACRRHGFTNAAPTVVLFPRRALRRESGACAHAAGVRPALRRLLADRLRQATSRADVAGTGMLPMKRSAGRSRRVAAAASPVVAARSQCQRRSDCSSRWLFFGGLCATEIARSGAESLRRRAFPAAR